MSAVGFSLVADLLEDIRADLHKSLLQQEAQVGRKAQGHGAEKSWVQRHGHAPKRSYNAAEKAAETKVRQAGKKAARDF